MAGSILFHSDKLVTNSMSVAETTSTGGKVTLDRAINDC